MASTRDICGACIIRQLVKGNTYPPMVSYRFPWVTFPRFPRGNLGKWPKWDGNKLTGKKNNEKCWVKGTVSRDFGLQVFFINQFPPALEYIPLGTFQIFSKNRGDIHSLRCTTSVVDTAGKSKKSSTRKLKFFTHLLVAGVVANLPPVSLILLAHLDLQISPRMLAKNSKWP